MFDRLSRSWELVKASAAVLQADKELLVFPVVSAALSLLVFVTFLAPLVLAGVFDASVIGQEGVPVAGYLMGFAFYVVQYFVIFFCNTALVGAALIRLRGGDPTVGDGFRIARERWANILGYALIAATVGMILRAISERAGFIGKLVVGLVGLAWNLATYLVVPVLVVENVGPIDAVKRSAAHLRKTWGEQIAGNLGMGLVFGLITFATVVGCMVLAAVAAAVDQPALAVGVLVVMVLALVGIALVSSALSGVYAAAVYRYAADGDTGQFFSVAMVKETFVRK